MLYIWPLFAFFSAPLLLPWILQTFLSLFVEEEAKTNKASTKSSPSSFTDFINLAAYACLTPLALTIVKYNTIIHPFTLADNRHYMFYVFRYSILQASWVRYALVLVYVPCGIMCWKTLGGFGSETRLQGQPQQNKTTTTTVTKNGNGKDNDDEQSKPPPPPIHDYLSSPTSASHLSPSLSTALLWVLTTMLSLMTAPLVEPRYFILPWVFWRLLMPAWSVPRALCLKVPLTRIGQRYDLRLWAETAWFVLVNVVTMYIFITKPFYWRDAEGNLADEGRVQRFMW